MFYFNDNLEVGDIILTNNIEKQSIIKSKLQKLHTKGNYTHVALYVGNGSFIEAVGEGVRFFSTTGVVFNDKSNFLVRRYKSKKVFSNERINVRKYTYMQYNYEGIKSFITAKNYEENNKVFCSQLVSKIYKDYGIQLFLKQDDKITPADFEISDLFVDVPNYFIESDEITENVYLIYDKNIQIKESILTIQNKIIVTFNQKLDKQYDSKIPSFSHAINILQNIKRIKDLNLINLIIKSDNKDIFKLFNLDDYDLSLVNIIFDLCKLKEIKDLLSFDKLLLELDDFLLNNLKEAGFFSLYTYLIMDKRKYFNLNLSFIENKKNFQAFCEGEIEQFTRTSKGWSMEKNNLTTDYKTTREYSTSLQISISFSLDYITILNKYLHELKQVI